MPALRISSICCKLEENTKQYVDQQTFIIIKADLGKQPPFPWVAGFEFAGIVSSAPKIEGARFKCGDRVFGAGQGAYATSICVQDSELQLIPHNWDFESAAGLYLTGPTSYAALKLRANVQEG